MRGAREGKGEREREKCCQKTRIFHQKRAVSAQKPSPLNHIHLGVGVKNLPFMYDGIVNLVEYTGS